MKYKIEKQEEKWEVLTEAISYFIDEYEKCEKDKKEYYVNLITGLQDIKYELFKEK